MTDRPAPVTRLRRRTVLLGLALILVAVPTAGPAWDRLQLMLGWFLPTRETAPMLVIAHRGDVERFPEDTAEAIWSAAAIGPDGIEFDVHQGADGTWWVIHDPKVDRTTDGEGWVHLLSDADLASLRIDGGVGFVGPEQGVYSPPRLRDVLEGLTGYQGLLIVDLQHAVAADAADLARHLAGTEAIVICRSIEDARSVEAVDPGLQTMLRSYLDETVDPVDYLLMDATRESTPDAVVAATLPVFTFMDEGAYGTSEAGWFRSAWATGVHAFLTKELSAALRLRAELATGRSP